MNPFRNTCLICSIQTKLTLSNRFLSKKLKKSWALKKSTETIESVHAVDSQERDFNLAFYGLPTKLKNLLICIFDSLYFIYAQNFTLNLNFKNNKVVSYEEHGQVSF